MAVVIYEDVDCEMACLCVDGECVFEGNYWDLPTNPTDLAAMLDKLKVANVTVEPYTYE